MNGLMVEFPPRSSCTRTSSRCRLIEAHTPIGPSPSMSLWTSSATESTLLPAKSSCPVQTNPCRAPSTLAKNGSLRSPADSRIGLAWTGWTVPSKLTGMSEASTSPDGSGLARRRWWRTRRFRLRAVLVLGEHERERDVGVVVAVGPHHPVERAGVERGPWPALRSDGRCQSPSESMIRTVSSRACPREHEHVGEVQAPVVTGELEAAGVKWLDILASLLSGWLCASG